MLRLAATWICLVLPLALSAQPAAPERLAGEFFLGGATLVDPPPGERTDSHAYLTITGAAARRIFAAMPGQATADACEPSRRSKRRGNLLCSAGRAANDASCSFALDLGRGTLAPGTPC